jgi:hypothetical protein
MAIQLGFDMGVFGDLPRIFELGCEFMVIFEVSMEFHWGSMGGLCILMRCNYEPMGFSSKLWSFGILWVKTRPICAVVFDV